MELPRFAYRRQITYSEDGLFCPPDNPLLSFHVTARSCKERTVLHQLPAELISHVIDNLDLDSILQTTATNKASRAMIFSLPKFIAIQRNAPSLLRGLTATRTSQYYTLKQISRALTTTKCCKTWNTFHCQRQGCYIFLLTLERRCWSCIMKSEYLLVTSLNEANALLEDFGGSDQLQRLQTIPGSYGYLDYKRNLPSDQVVRFADIERAQGLSSPDTKFGFLIVKQPGLTFPSAGSLISTVQMNAEQHAYTWACCTPVPSFASMKTLTCEDQPVYCRGCKHVYGKEVEHSLDEDPNMACKMNVAMSMEEFELHAQTCQGIAELREQSTNVYDP